MRNIETVQHLWNHNCPTQEYMTGLFMHLVSGSFLTFPTFLTFHYSYHYGHSLPFLTFPSHHLNDRATLLRFNTFKRCFRAPELGSTRGVQAVHPWSSDRNHIGPLNHCEALRTTVLQGPLCGQETPQKWTECVLHSSKVALSESTFCSDATEWRSIRASNVTPMSQKLPRQSRQSNVYSATYGSTRSVRTWPMSITNS